MHVETKHVAILSPIIPPAMTGLRCRWVAIEDENGMHLVARWSYKQNETWEEAISADPLAAPKEGESCWRTTLYFVWDSH